MRTAAWFAQVSVTAPTGLIQAGGGAGQERVGGTGSGLRSDGSRRGVGERAVCQELGGALPARAHVSAPIPFKVALLWPCA